MPLTPADVHNVAFKKPPIGKRGYDEDEVDAFLDEVEREFARLIEENNDLKSQVGGGGPEAGGGSAKATSRKGDTPPAAQAQSQAPSEGQQRLANENAELTARLKDLEKQLREAKEAGPAGPTDSEQALSVLMTAQRTANEHVSDARREADKLLSDARTTAAELHRSAKATAAALEKDAQDKHQAAMGGLEVKRQSLEKHIEELKAFEREYRSRLQSFLETQLRELNGKAPAADGAGRPTGGASSPATAPASRDGAAGTAPAGAVGNDSPPAGTVGAAASGSGGGSGGSGSGSEGQSGSRA
jgi:DivIVA domain-containing protein